MASSKVSPIEDRLTKILTPLSGLLAAAGGLAGITGVLTPAIRGSENLAFFSFILLVFGFLGLIYVRLFEWEPGDVNARHGVLGLVLICFALSVVLGALVYIQAIGRDHRPTITVSVTTGQRTTVTGSVTSTAMAADERLAVDIRIGPDPVIAKVVLGQVTGPDSTGTGTITINSAFDVPPDSVILVEAWLPDRVDTTPNCSIAETGDAAPTAAPTVAPHPTPSHGIVDHIQALIPAKQPFVSCMYILPPPFLSAGPKVTISSDVANSAVSVTVASPVLASEAVLLQVWDRAHANKLLYSSLVYPGDSGEAAGTATIGIGKTGADICAIAVQGPAITLASLPLDPPTACRSTSSSHQGWAELLIPTPPKPTPKVAAK